MLDFLREEGIDESILHRIQEFHAEYPVSEGMRYRVPKPKFHYYGKEIWNQALTALLAGENLLLVGPKATGKNVLAENLAAVFDRPAWDIPAEEVSILLINGFHSKPEDPVKDGDVVSLFPPVGGG